ncbi:hypothetical protein WL29_22850 [Burkholderia ubonensis]|uniref:DNA-binding protein H-NS-like C-terminal domain-containing protein n=1 Tax=Burkholderia ubonensis TaxID=101571 RepID=A0A106QDA7_9BURK|nr:H-NS family nucleoid-associated regulatory protein [Burkholderia ubonensis]KWA84203.1 hypothetical protein WL29_22850 [Burkholderia ubonensis]
MATIEAIKARIQKLQSQADALMAQSKQAAIQKIHTLMLENELTLADIGEPGKRAKGRGVKQAKANGKGTLPPKYRNPKTGETWSGHARPPAWIKDVKDRTKFLIDKSAASENAKSSVSLKKPSKAKGKKVPIKYRDPESGATWTGRGRAPAWIAEAADRDQFLIA